MSKIDSPDSVGLISPQRFAFGRAADAAQWQIAACL